MRRYTTNADTSPVYMPIAANNYANDMSDLVNESDGGTQQRIDAEEMGLEQKDMIQNNIVSFETPYTQKAR